MKDLIKKIILLIIIILFLQLILFIFKTKHNVNYIVVNNKEKIKINETYKNNNYLFDIEYKNKNITFSYDNKFYKAKKVIKDILVYEKDDLVCIYPILKNNKFYNIICSKDNNIYHYNYFKDELTDFTAYLQEKGYFNSSWINNDVKKNMGNVISYYENINKDTYIYGNIMAFIHLVIKNNRC